jgi:hypothetical protein
MIASNPLTQAFVRCFANMPVFLDYSPESYNQSTTGKDCPWIAEGSGFTTEKRTIKRNPHFLKV